VTFWRCWFRRSVRSSSVPSCTGARVLQLQVNFPNCWDGSRLDSADHKSHMAYSVDGRCPDTHQVETPALSIVVYYRVVDSAGAELASGSQFSGHADFINAWNQEKLVALVDRYLNRTGRRAK
jgi:hypothetical protein